MSGLGTVVNVAAILAGGAAGLVLKRVLSERITETVMQGVGLAVAVIGLSGALSASFRVTGGEIVAGHTLLMILSLAIGGLIGALIGIEDKLQAFTRFCEGRFAKKKGTASFADGFVMATLVFSVGSMAVVGALEDGIHQNSDILFAKSLLDGITAAVFASTMGAGVLFSAAAVGIYQGTLTLLAVFLAPYLSDDTVAAMSVVGSVLIMGIGFNLLRVTKIKVGDLLPAMAVPAVYAAIRQLL